MITIKQPIRSYHHSECKSLTIARMSANMIYRPSFHLCTAPSFKRYLVYSLQLHSPTTFLKFPRKWDDADGWASWNCCVERSSEASSAHAMKWAASWLPWASLPRNHFPKKQKAMTMWTRKTRTCHRPSRSNDRCCHHWACFSRLISSSSSFGLSCCVPIHRTSSSFPTASFLSHPMILLAWQQHRLPSWRQRPGLD